MRANVPSSVDGLERGVDGRGDVLVPGDRDAEPAEGPGHEAEVGVLQLRPRYPGRVVPFLMRADGAVFLVVHDDHQGRGAVLGGGGQLLAVHQELPVPGDGHHPALRAGQRGGDGRGDGVAHGAVPGADHGGVAAGGEVPVCPVGVLACAECHHGVLGQPGDEVGHQGVHPGGPISRRGRRQGGEGCLFGAHPGRPRLPFLLDRAGRCSPGPGRKRPVWPRSGGRPDRSGRAGKDRW